MQMKPRHLAVRRSIEIRERKEHAFRLGKLKENLPRHAKKAPQTGLPKARLGRSAPPAAPYAQT